MRKKAQIEAMERENARLKRESIILGSLPDPVVAIGIDGEITFANARTRRMLQLNHNEIVGANIGTFVAPDSKEELKRMISDVVDAENRMAIQDSPEDSQGDIDSGTDGEGVNNAKGSEQQSSVDMDEDNTDSDQSNKKQSYVEKHVSSLTESSKSEEPPVKRVKTDSTSADEDAKLLLHYHKNEVKEQDEEDKDSSNEKQAQPSSAGSSLSETKEESPSSSDSGYADSNASRQDSNSSASSLSNNKLKRQVQRSLPLAPACIIALVRKDLSKVWCELTASIRTRSIVDGDFDAMVVSQISCASSSGDSAESEMNSAKELLICFRPIAEGPMEDNAAAGRMAQDDAAGDKSKQEAASNEARI